VVLPVPDHTGVAISSTRIRRAVAGGDLELAAQLLGRPFQLSAVVAAGAGRGRLLGVPTINLAVPPRKLLPPDGVYAVWVEARRGRYRGMLNQGPRPTVGDPTRTIEAHLLEFEGDLYGTWVRIEWVRRIRDGQRFPSLEALRAQLERDREAAESILG
jgi:riboflavin kinase/FMN adenylyltransferase